MKRSLALFTATLMTVALLMTALGGATMAGHKKGTEGCTPGYWKQSQHFDSWAGYSPDTQFSSVFEDAFPGLSLLEVLQLPGGGLNRLGSHTVASLLNAANSDVHIGWSTGNVIDAFNDVYPGTKSEYNAQKDIFVGRNELGCPLN